MTEPSSLGLLDQAERYETPQGGRCSVCEFIEAQPPDQQAEWDALLVSPRRPPAVHKVMRDHGYRHGTDPVRNHRSGRHRT